MNPAHRFILERNDNERSERRDRPSIIHATNYVSVRNYANAASYAKAANYRTVKKYENAANNRNVLRDHSRAVAYPAGAWFAGQLRERQTPHVA